MQNYKQPKSYIRRTGRFSRRRVFRGLGGRVRHIAKRTILTMSETKYAFNYAVNTLNNLRDGPLLIEITPQIITGTGKHNRIGQKIKYSFLSVNVAVNLKTTQPQVNWAHAPILMARVTLLQGRTTVNPNNLILYDLDITQQNPFLVEPFYPLMTINPAVARVMNDELTSLVAENTNTNAINVSSGHQYMGIYKFRHRVNNNVTFGYGDEGPMNPQDRYWLAITLAPIYYPTDVNDLNDFVMQCRWFSRLSFKDI